MADVSHLHDTFAKSHRMDRGVDCRTQALRGGKGMSREGLMMPDLVPALDLVLNAQADANASSKGNCHSNYLRKSRSMVK